MILLYVTYMSFVKADYELDEEDYPEGDCVPITRVY